MMQNGRYTKRFYSKGRVCSICNVPIVNLSKTGKCQKHSQKGMKHKPHSEETKAKIRAKRAQQVFTPESKAKQIAALKSFQRPQKKVWFCQRCGVQVGWRSKHCRKCYHMTAEFKAKVGARMKKLSAEGKHPWSIKPPKRLKGKDNPMWRGGMSLKEAKIQRHSNRNWQKARMRILVRDNFTCQKCGEEGFVAAHKIPWDGETLQFKLEDLVTLCHKCHMRMDGQRRSVEYAEKKNSRLNNDSNGI